MVLPSIWNEPFGRIPIEAVYNGTIAIGSDRGGIPEALDHNADYIFQSGDAAGLRSRIERVIRMSPSAYAEAIGRQQRGASGFSEDRYAENWERFFLRQL